MAGFWIAYSDSTGARDTGTEAQLQPKPSLVVYPTEGQAGTIIETPGGVVVQSASKDSRIREWVWERYPGWLPQYNALWNQIQPLRAYYRKLAGDATPFVWLKDDETQLLRSVSVSGTTVTESYGWFRCRVHRVIRPELSESSSLVTYARTRLLFSLADESFNDF